MNTNKEPELEKNNSGSKTKITLKNITKSFSGITVLNNINLEFTSGEIHGLVGQNGAGKSTLGKIIGGHYKLSSGKIFLNDNLIKKWSSKIALDNGIAMIHQELALVPGMTVYDNIFLGIEENYYGIIGKQNTKLFNDLDQKIGLILTLTKRYQVYVLLINKKLK